MKLKQKVVLCRWLFVVFGVLALLTGMITAGRHASIRKQVKNYTAKTQGIVVKAEDKKKNASCTVEFEVDGKTYTVKTKQTGIHSGMNISVSYNPDKPKQAFCGLYPNRSGYNRSLGLTIFNGIVTVIGIAGFIKFSRDYKEFGDEDEDVSTAEA